MMRVIAFAALTSTAGCMVDQFTPSFYACTASQHCSEGTCDPSDLDFNVTSAIDSGVTLDFVDGSFALAFTETTTAALPDRAVTLTTYQSADTAVRLTLANDGSPTVRARLMLGNNAAARDISATCFYVPGGTG